MLARNTVLVLGAGSSVEFNLPAGLQLAATIAAKVGWHRSDEGDLTSGDRRLLEFLRRYKPELEGIYFKAGQMISRGLPLSQSIDDFLYIHEKVPEAVFVGKAAIA